MVKLNTTITIEKDTKERALKLMGSKGQKLSAVVELYLKKLLEEEKSKKCKN